MEVTSHQKGHRFMKRCICMVLLLWAGQAIAAPPPGHWRAIQSMVFNPAGTELATAGDDGLIHIWNPETGARIRTMDGHRNRICKLAYAVDGGSLISASWDGTVKRWNDSGALARTFKHITAIRSAAVSRDGKTLAAGGNDGALLVWDAQTGELEKQLSVSGTWVGVPGIYVDLAFSPDGKTLAAAHASKSVDLYDTGTWKNRGTIPGFRGANLDYTSDDILLIGSRRAQEVEVWNPKTIQRVKTFPEVQKPRLFASSESVLLFGTSRGIESLNRSTGKTAVFADWRGGPEQLALSRDGKITAATGLTGEIRIWNAGRELTIPRRDLAMEKRETPKRMDPSLLGLNLAADSTETPWKIREDTDGMFAQTDEGIRFAARSMAQHMTGHDAWYIPIGIAAAPFQLDWELRVDRSEGHPLFTPGLVVGLSSGEPGMMHGDDLAVAMSTQYAGVYAGILRGEPYYPKANYVNMGNASHTSLTDRYEVPVLRYDNAFKRMISGSEVIRKRIRRDGLGHLTFTVWAPALGQDVNNPWRQARITVDEHGDKALNYLFVKRIPLLAHHLGGEDTGYQGFELSGRITSLTLRLNPPAVKEMTWAANVLKPGMTVTVTGSDLLPGTKVNVGGKSGLEIRTPNESTLTFKLPEVADGKRYDLEMIGPNGIRDLHPGAIPVGAVVDTVNPGTIAARGDVIEVRGAGFDKNTRFKIGSQPATVEKVSKFAATLSTPTLKTGQATVTAEGVSGAAACSVVKRPRILFNEEELKKLRIRFNAPQFADYRQRMLPPEDAKQDHDLRTPSIGGHFPDSAYNLFWRYVHTGDESYKERLFGWVRVFAESGLVRDIDHSKPGLTALIYDMLGDEMEPALRNQVEAYLHKALDWYILADKENEWFAVNNSYTSPQTAEYAIRIALSLDHLRDDIDPALEAAKRRLSEYLDKCWFDDGGAIEGQSRNTTALAAYLRSAWMLERHRNDRDLLNHPHLKNIRRQFETLLAPDHRYLPFRDSHDRLTDPSAAALLAKYTDDPFFIWVTDRGIPGGKGRPSAAMALLYRPDGPTPEAPKLPTLAVLKSIGWGIMRSEPNVNANLVVGIKGGDGPLPYHHQKDVGSFVIYAQGEPLLIDPGWGMRRWEDHSLPVIDGGAGDPSGSVITVAQEHGDWRLMVVDSTKAYAKTGARRVRRHILMFKNTHVFALDDLVGSDTGDGVVQSRFQAVSLPSIDGTGATIAGEIAQAHITFDGPELSLSQEKIKRAFPLVASYTIDPDRPLLTTIVLSRRDTPQPQTPQPQTPQIERSDKSITIRFSDTSAGFHKSASGWIGRIEPEKK